MGVRAEHIRHSRKVTRGPRWKALRMAVLERDGYACRSCGARGRLECDHIQPVRTHPELAYEPTNLQALCPSCHTRKTRIECGHPEQDPERRAWASVVGEMQGRPRLFSIPHGLRPSKVPVILVFGPPGAGKTTLVRAEAAPGDVVIDFDDHLADQGARPWSTDRAAVKAAFATRDAALRNLASRTRGRAWVILLAPSLAERRAWKRALVRLTERPVATDAETCKARIKADPAREHAADKMLRAVDTWWTTYAETQSTSRKE